MWIFISYALHLQRTANWLPAGPFAKSLKVLFHSPDCAPESQTHKSTLKREENQQRRMGTNINKPTHLSFVDNLETQAECNSVSRRAVNAKKWFLSIASKCLFIVRWEIGVSVQVFFILSQQQGRTNCSAVSMYSLVMHILLILVIFNGVFSLSVSVSPSMFVCLLPFIHPNSFFFSLSLIVCSCGVFLSFPGRWWLQSDPFWLHSQAEHQNTQHWWVTLSLLKNE